MPDRDRVSLGNLYQVNEFTKQSVATLNARVIARRTGTNSFKEVYLPIDERMNPRKYRVAEFLVRKTGFSVGLVIILISQLVASVMVFVLDIASCAPGGRPRVVQFVCRFDIVTSSSLIMQPRTGIVP